MFISLIVVNCAILGRAESFATKNPPVITSYSIHYTKLYEWVMRPSGAVTGVMVTSAR